MKKLATMMLSGLLLAGAFAAEVAPQANPAQAPEQKAQTPEELFSFLPEVVAKVNGKDITRQELVKFFVGEMPDGKIPPMLTSDLLKQMAPELVRGYVSQMLLTSAAEKAGLKPSADAVKAAFAKQMKNLKPEELEMVKQQLQLQDKTMDSYIAEMAAQPKVQQQVAIMEFLEKELAGKATVSDQDAKTFYDKNPQMFKTQADPEDAIRASHILVMVPKDATAQQKAEAKKKIEDILAQIQKDKSKFEELAIAMSDCPSGKQAKGSLGSFRRGAMVKAFEDAAFALKEGELSGVVETEFGYHIIRRDARQEAKAIPFEEVKENLINFLKRQKLEEANLAYMEQLLKDNKVEFLVQAPALQLPEK